MQNFSARVLALLFALGPLDLARNHMLVRNPGENVADAVEPHPALVIGLDRVRGTAGISVYRKASSLALEYSTHISRDSISISISFQRLSGFLARPSKRNSCSSAPTDS